MKRGQLLAGLLVGLLALLSCGDQHTKIVTLQFKFNNIAQLTYEKQSRSTRQVTESGHNGDLVSAQQQENVTWQLRKAPIPDSAVGYVIYEITERDTGDAHLADTATLYLARNGEIHRLDSIPADQQDLLRNFTNLGLPVFPTGEHSQGFQWVQTTHVVDGDDIWSANTQYELVSFAREQGYDCAVISYVGQLTLPPRPVDSFKVNLVSGEDRVRCAGHIYFAYREGIVIVQKERWVVEGMRVFGSSDGTQDTIAINLEYDNDLSLADVKLAKD